MRHARDDSSARRVAAVRERIELGRDERESGFASRDVYGVTDDVWGHVCGVYHAGERLDAGRVRDESSRGENWEEIGVEGAGRDEED